MAVVVITGASSGIGEATTRLLARQGHQLVLAARSGDRLARLAAELQPDLSPQPRTGVPPSTGLLQSAPKPQPGSGLYPNGEPPPGAKLASQTILCVPTDLSDPDQIEALALAAGRQFGWIDVWINNAGVGGPTPIWWEAGVAELRHVIDVDLIAPMLCVRAALPWMLAEDRRRPVSGAQGHLRGHFIQVGSVAGHIGVRSPYSAAKFGVRGFTESLRRELSAYRIGVSLVSPGFVRTAMTTNVPIRMPSPDLVAQAIARLIRQPRREVVVPGWYRLPILLNRTLPGLVDLAVGWFYRHQGQYLPRRGRPRS